MNRNVTATILIVLSIGIYFTVTQGQIDAGNEIRAVNNQYASAIDTAGELIKVRDQVQENYKKISDEDRARLDKMLPSSVDNIRLIIDLNSVALRHGFSLRNIKAEAAVNNSQGAVRSQGAAGSLSIASSTLDTVKVTFSVTAPYQQFRSFLQDLEASLRIIDLAHLTVTGSDTGTYEFGVELRTYWLRQ